MSKFNFVRCEDMTQWDEFVKSSPQGTIFSRSDFNKIISTKTDYYFVEKEGEILGGVSVNLDNVRRSSIISEHSQYANCILLKDNSKKLMRQKIKEEFEVVEFILSSLLEIYDSYSTICTPQQIDIRPFQWLNYGKISGHKFELLLRYTAVLDIKNKTKEQILSEMRKDRLRDYGKSEFRVEVSPNFDVLDKLHELTFRRQNISRSESEINELKAIAMASLSNNFGRLCVCYVDEQPASASLFLFDNKRSYYLIGANDPEFRSSGASTNVIINNILHAKKIGLEEVDFVGANSPNRGDYKISFNCSLIPYYYCSTIKMNR